MTASLLISDVARFSESLTTAVAQNLHKTNPVKVRKWSLDDLLATADIFAVGCVDMEVCADNESSDEPPPRVGSRTLTFGEEP